MTLGDQDLGTEHFVIHASAGQVVATGEIHIQVKKGDEAIDMSMFPTLTLDSELEPQTYRCSRKGSQAFQLDVDFRSPLAQSRLQLANAREDDRAFALPKDVVVLDDNVVHHYQLLVDRYAESSGGTQTFRAFVPQEAVSGEVTVRDLGSEKIHVLDKSEKLRHLLVATQVLEIDLWVDSHHRLQRASNRTLNIIATRKD